MYNFLNDYSLICHSKIAELIALKHNEKIGCYYGGEATAQLNATVKKMLGNSAESIVMLGGTQTNVFVIKNMLRSYEAVICADTAHINVHEAGAVEHSGIKLCCVHSVDGKVTVDSVRAALEEYSDPHQVKPRMLYISQTTELGTLYSKSELQALSDCCAEHNLIFYIDGARLGSALTCADCDFSIKDIFELCDLFYLGGTKCGLPIGELLIYKTGALNDTALLMKQCGVLLAKGDFISLMFNELLSSGLFVEVNKKANESAAYLAERLKKRGVSFKYKPQTNQLFPIVSNAKIAELQKEFEFVVWEKHDTENSVIRLVTSYATEKSEIDAFIRQV